MTKRKRLAQIKDDLQDLGPDDLLSRFSDDILVSILSYLSIREAAVTSKLSRRWRYLWCQTVRLDFEDKESLNRTEKARHLCGLKEWNKYINFCFAERNKYINWVNRVIRQHKGPNIDKFKICFDLDKNAKGAIGKWIEFAISKNVRTLELDVGDDLNFCNKGDYVFPFKIFDRKYESSLKRSYFNVRGRPYATSMEIKFLKALILKCVDVNDEGLKKILSNCPVLEHLSIYRSRNLVKAKIHGKRLALKNLEIICCRGLESIEICDSNIVSFKCGESNFYPPISLRLDNLQKLEKISICNYEMKIDHMFSQLSCSIPYLQVLELIVFHPQKDRQFFPFLPQLKRLIMDVGALEDGCLSALTSLVEACPNLQRFTVKLRWLWLWSKYGRISKEVRQAAKQPHQHLEVVEIVNYHGQIIDLELAMYFFENSVALKKLVIIPYIGVGLAAYEIMVENNAARYRAHEQLEQKTPVGVELVIA